jgi:hypothetical protein
VKSGAGHGETDPLLFTHENVLAQIATAPFSLGAYTLRFYAEDGKPVNRMTPLISVFYLYPSGGAIRDSEFHLVLYDSRYDTYRGFILPHMKKP